MFLYISIRERLWCVSQSELSVTSSGLDGLHYISHAGVPHKTQPTLSFLLLTAALFIFIFYEGTVEK